MYKIFELLLEKYGVTAYKVAKETGITTATLTSWKHGRYIPKQEKLQKIADYFGVSLDYLTTGNEPEEKEPSLTPKDERDIARDLERMMQSIKEGKDGPLYYDGKEIDNTSLTLLENALEGAMKTMKIINKEKYNPNKNKK